MKSIVESLILDRSFDYLQPYFYSNPFALRCELGTGDTPDVYMDQARNRAAEIYRILFPKKADAIIFNQWIYDWSDSGDAEMLEHDGDVREVIERRMEGETRALRFLFENMMYYRHVSLKDMKTYDHDDFQIRRNRIICYADDTGFDDQGLIMKQIADEDNLEVGLVSFENECILSVYDDRGCDVFFPTHGAMKKFYRLLEPFFLRYDYEEMKKRFDKV